jgi:hypothetical protein
VRAPPGSATRGLTRHAGVQHLCAAANAGEVPRAGTLLPALAPRLRPQGAAHLHRPHGPAGRGLRPGPRHERGGAQRQTGTAAQRVTAVRKRTKGRACAEARAR